MKAEKNCLNCKWAKWDRQKIRGMQYGTCQAAGSLATHKNKIAELMPYDNCPKWEPQP